MVNGGMPGPPVGLSADVLAAFYGGGGGAGTNFFDLFDLTAEQAQAARSLMGQINPDTNQPYTAFEAAAGLSGIFQTGPFAPTPPSYAPHAPPAFGGTEAGLRLQGALAMEQQGLIGEQQLAQIAAQAATQLELAGLNNEAAMARQLAADTAAFKRSLAGEVGAGARAQLGEVGATRRSLFGEMGAGARTQMQTATQRAIAAGQNVSDTFGRMAAMSTDPSDYLKLAYNVQGMRPMADTPTDIARQEMQKFYQGQTGLAAAPQQTFSSLFQPMRETVSDLPNYGDLFQQARRKVGGFQFGGRSSSGAAITGERGKPELVTGKDIKVTPNLSKIEIRALRLGGVGGKQFGTTARTDDLRKRLLEDQSPAGPSGGIASPTVLERLREDRAAGQTQPTAVPQPVRTNVFDIEQQRPGYEAPLFTGGYGRAAYGGVGAASGLAGLNPLDYSVQSVNRMLPFEQQMLMGRFGESIVDPTTGEVIRAGMDPASVLEMIRRSSWVGGAPSISRWG